MPYELIHFRGSKKILQQKKMKKDLLETLEYIDHALYEAPNRGELLKQALEEMGWRDKETLPILEGRGYRLKGCKNQIAMEGNFSAYEFILEGMIRLQLSFDRGEIQMGVLLLTSLRSEKSRFGSTRELCEHEVENLLHPTISLPVCVALYDLGEPRRETKGEDLSELRQKHKADSKEAADPQKQEHETPETASI